MNSQDSRTNLIAEIESARSVETMCASPGWKVLKSHFNTILEVITQKILEEKDHLSIIRLQERYRAFRSMLEVSEDFVKIKQLREKELKDIDLEDKYIQDYGLTN